MGRAAEQPDAADGAGASDGAPQLIWVWVLDGRGGSVMMEASAVHVSTARVAGMLDAGVFIARLRQPHWKRGAG